MGEILSVVSGKGGTGKTTLCAGIASCLAAEDKRVLCIDADIGLRNLDIALGMSEQSILTFTDVMNGLYDLTDATAHPRLDNLFLLTAPFREEGLDREAFRRLLETARERFDFCLIDAPAGVGTGFQLATAFSDRCLVVSTPDPASMRDAAAAADQLTLAGKENLSLIVNRVTPKLFRKMELTVDDMMDSVGLPLLGLVPEDPMVMLAAARGCPLVLAATEGAAEACLRIARRLRGVTVPLMKF